MVGVFGLSMFAFYAVQVEGAAVLPIEWQDGRWFLLCATMGSWIFGLSVFKLLKAEVDWRLTMVFLMLGRVVHLRGGELVARPGTGARDF
jgi:hypothetical protein